VEFKVDCRGRITGLLLSGQQALNARLGTIDLSLDAGETARET